MKCVWTSVFTFLTLNSLNAPSAVYPKLTYVDGVTYREGHDVWQLVQVLVQEVLPGEAVGVVVGEALVAGTHGAQCDEHRGGGAQQ